MDGSKDVCRANARAGVAPGFQSQQRRAESKQRALTTDRVGIIALT